MTLFLLVFAVLWCENKEQRTSPEPTEICGQKDQISRLSKFKKTYVPVQLIISYFFVVYQE